MGKTGVFDAGVTYTEPNPYLTGWSHNVKMQFYLRAIENSLITVRHREAERVGIERNLGFFSEEIGVCTPEFMQMCMGDLTKGDTTAAKSFIVSTDGTKPAFPLYGIQGTLTEDAAGNTGALAEFGDAFNLKSAAYASKGDSAAGSYRRMYKDGIGIYAIFEMPSDSTDKTPHFTTWWSVASSEVIAAPIEACISINPINDFTTQTRPFTTSRVRASSQDQKNTAAQSLVPFADSRIQQITSMLPEAFSHNSGIKYKCQLGIHIQQCEL